MLAGTVRSTAVRVGMTVALAAVMLACIVLPASATEPAQEVARLHTSFRPDRLGASTTIGFKFEVRTVDGLAPPPLIGMDLHMPAGMDYVNTTLGLRICTEQTLLKHGTAACPANSRLGSGSAFVEVPFGKGAGKELPEISAFMGPPKDENMVVLFYVDGTTPVYGQFVFAGEVLPDTGIFGSELNTEVPIVHSVPNGPDVSIVRAQAQIGPEHLTYYKRVHGKMRAFKPRGISVPEHCPKGGFPFIADLFFQDGSRTEASSTVPCPKHTGRKHHKRHKGHGSRAHAGSRHRRHRHGAHASRTVPRFD